METVNFRIKKVRDTFCQGRNIDFAAALGKHPNVTSNYVRDGYSVGRSVVREIADRFGVSEEWLMSGAGDMLPQEQEETGQDADRLLRIIESQQETIDQLTRIIAKMTDEKGERIARPA